MNLSINHHLFFFNTRKTSFTNIQTIISFLFKTTIKYENRSIKDPKSAFKIIKRFLGNTDREYFIVVNLNSRNEPCSVEICSIGTLTTTITHPREIFKSAIATNAEKIIIAHSHPNNSLEHSSSNITTTHNLLNVANILQIPIIDHLILGEDDFFSFAEHGLLFENVQL